MTDSKKGEEGVKERNEASEREKGQVDDIKSGALLLFLRQISSGLRRIAAILLFLLMILGSTLRSSVLHLLLLLMIMGGYVFPNITGYYTDVASLETNISTAGELQCGVCHPDISGAIAYAMGPGAVGEVANSHREASREPIYVGPGAVIDIPFTPTESIDDVCWMCHYKENNDRIGKESHFNRSEGFEIVTRACTDLDCHGDESQTTSGPIWGEIRTNVTGRISHIMDAHSRFYNPLNTMDSTLENEDGGFYTQGYITCLACHTHSGMEFDVTRPNKYSLVLRGGILESAAANLSSTNTTLGVKNPGSAWR